MEFNLPAPIYTDFISFHLQQIVECSKPFIETQRWYCYGEIINGRYIDNIEYKGLIANTVEQLVSSLNLTPRMIEKLFMRVKLTIESLGEDDLLLPEVIFILNVLYICDKKAFDSYVKTEAYNANLGDLGIKINKVYPYWTSVLNNFNEIYKTCHKKDKISLGTNESNILNLVNLIQQSAYRSHIYPFEQDIVKYLKSYASKIEFIGSMD